MNTDVLFELSPPALLAAALYIVGIFLKRSPVPSWTIPWVVTILGAVIFPFIVEEGTVVYNSRHPEVYTALIGACIGGFPTVAHEGITGFLERKNGKKPAEMPDNAEK